MSPTDPLDAALPHGLPIRMRITPSYGGRPGAGPQRAATALHGAFRAKLVHPRPQGGIVLNTEGAVFLASQGATHSTTQTGADVWRFAGQGANADDGLLIGWAAPDGFIIHPSVFCRGWRTKMRHGPVHGEPLDVWKDACLSAPVVFDREEAAIGKGFVPWWAIDNMPATLPKRAETWWQTTAQLLLGAALTIGTPWTHLRIRLLPAVCFQNKALWIPDSPLRAETSVRGPSDLRLHASLMEAIDPVFAARLAAPDAPLSPIHAATGAFPGGKPAASFLFPHLVDGAPSTFTAHEKMAAIAAWQAQKPHSPAPHTQVPP